MLSHVLEHLYDPFKVAEILKNKLYKCGIVYSIVPLQTKSEIYIGETEDRPNPHFVSFENGTEHSDFWIKSGYKILNEVNHQNGSEREHRLILSID